MLRILFLVQICLISKFLCQSEINVSNASDGLISVAVIYRHGDRTPIDPYPKDPYLNRSYWPVGFGQLTNLGKKRQFELGQWLRKRYQNFLPDIYSEEDLYVRATDVDRTLMSAEVNLAALFPPLAKQKWNPNLAWQPIPVHTTPENEDNVLGMKKPCEKYNHLLHKLLESPEFVAIRKKNHDLYSYISRNSGKMIKTLQDLEYIYSTLTIETSNNFTLPNWTKSVFPSKIKPWAELSFAVSCYTPNLARLKTGPLFNDILNHFINATQNKKTHKMFVYSAHDTTIANVLTSLNAFEYHCPPFTATILMELRLLNGKYVVNILYKNSSVPQKIVLKDCQFDCPFENFITILEPITVDPEEWKAECQMKLLGIIPFTTLQSIVFISCTALLLLMLTSFSISIICTKVKKSEKKTYFRLANEDT